MFIFGLTSVAEFMENLFKNIDKSAETIGLLQTSFEKTKESCRNRAKEQLKKLHDRNYTAGTTTSRRIVQFLYAVQRICGGTYQVTTGTDLSYIILKALHVYMILKIDSGLLTLFLVMYCLNVANILMVL